VRNDAPHDLRGYIVDFAYESGLTPDDVRTVVCKVLMTRPDPNNWSPFPNVDGECRDHLDRCKWFEVYDIIESLHSKLESYDRIGGMIGDSAKELPAARFTRLVNAFFVRKGIGWQLKNGQVVVRGPEAFEVAVQPVVEKLREASLHTAATEIHEALQDLARRPDPDVTGAIQHAMAATECVAREAAGDPKSTLGEIIARHNDLIPAPLDVGLTKIWGYSSEMARHIREGRSPSYDEAELAVITSAGVMTYLLRKLQR
jgi:hypothetical protein